MTPEMTGRQETTNQKRRMELTLDLINARVSLTGQQRNQIREILREQFSAAIKEEREACAKIADTYESSMQEQEEQIRENIDAFGVRTAAEMAIFDPTPIGRAGKTIADKIRARSS